ncbi:hypothetical protein GCM10010401_11070 [Rarobacter faecitabidus]|uniref:hypothetical protein n=1 Tax=Rarobacter faecitabidus TaxID=13243 RepID=UPI0011526469|nr:hypothetical protein [Rarobacter faecitabidus]
MTAIPPSNDGGSRDPRVEPIAYERPPAGHVAGVDGGAADLAAPDYAAEPAPANLTRGLLTGLGFGVAATILYVVVAVSAEKEYAVLSVLIGLAVGFGFSRFGRTKGAQAGLCAALVTLALFLVAIVLMDAGLNAKYLGTPFLEELRISATFLNAVISLYFSDLLSYVFVAAAVIVAFFQGAGFNKKAR